MRLDKTKRFAARFASSGKGVLTRGNDNGGKHDQLGESSEPARIAAVFAAALSRGGFAGRRAARVAGRDPGTQGEFRAAGTGFRKRRRIPRAVRRPRIDGIYIAPPPHLPRPLSVAA
jgi:hypothetical protein